MSQEQEMLRKKQAEREAEELIQRYRKYAEQGIYDPIKYEKFLKEVGELKRSGVWAEIDPQLRETIGFIEDGLILAQERVRREEYEYDRRNWPFW